MSDAKPVILLNIVLDESGSMSPGDDARKAINTYLDTLAEDRRTKDSDQAYKVSLTKFSTEHKVLYSDIGVEAAPRLSYVNYTPNGGTALLDAMGDVISRVKTQVAAMAVRPKILIVVMTDGEENSSREFSHAKIKDLIKELEAEGNWTFVYLGSAIRAHEEAARMGFSGSNVNKFKPDALVSNFRAIATSTQAYASAKSMNSSAFYNSNKSDFTALGSVLGADAVVQNSVPTPTVVPESVDATKDEEKKTI